MIPIFKKIQSKGKKLIIWGEMSKEDIDFIKTNLKAKELLEYMK
ncbi:hypothetical protein [Clostridium sp.]|nr:hypothetical protein [Clostridium sp.]